MAWRFAIRSVISEDLEETAGDGDGLLLGRLGVDPPHVHRPLPREVPLPLFSTSHNPRHPSRPAGIAAAASSEDWKNKERKNLWAGTGLPLPSGLILVGGPVQGDGVTFPVAAAGSGAPLHPANRADHPSSLSPPSRWRLWPLGLPRAPVGSGEATAGCRVASFEGRCVAQ
ncbi:hypothetical protein GUJ93_ZPchr0003g17201 [Zizania palustris]|uniref:Uncharacterized protein n=1 Tax=Zizania palustris TaxID=103762 RepID=A0A8J5VX87_ZIZPA|nr:hypothetical protein GUJ93_ZPchr0003g17201 [Zizania palustris]